LLDQFRLSARLSVSMTAKTVRDRPVVTKGTYWLEVTTRLLSGPISNPYDYPFPKLGITTPSQNLHRKLRPNGARYNGSLY